MVMLVNPTKLTAGVLRPCKFLRLFPLILTVVFRRRVVCPLALFGQWADEIEKMMNLRALKHEGILRTAGKNSSFVYVLYTTLVNLLFYIDTVIISSSRPTILSSWSTTLTTYLWRSISRLPSRSTLVEVQDMQWSAFRQVFPSLYLNLKYSLLSASDGTGCAQTGNVEMSKGSNT